MSWIYSKPKSAAAQSKGWSLEYDHNSKSRITWSFFSLANRQKLYEIPMITVMSLYLVALSYLSVFLRSLELSGLRLQPRSNQLRQKNYQVVYIVNQFTIYSVPFCIFMLGIASEAVLWLGLKGFPCSIGTWSVSLLNWCVPFLTATDTTNGISHEQPCKVGSWLL